MNRRNVLGAAIGGVLACVGLGKRAKAAAPHEPEGIPPAWRTKHGGIVEVKLLGCGEPVSIWMVPSKDGTWHGWRACPTEDEAMSVFFREPSELKAYYSNMALVSVPTEPILVDYMVASSTSEYNDLVPITVLYKDGRWQVEAGPVKRVFHKEGSHANP